MLRGIISPPSDPADDVRGPPLEVPYMKRSIPLCIILYLFTCGIYPIYWMIVLNDEINAASRQSGPSGGMVFLYSLITCGIYSLYWIYCLADDINKIDPEEAGTSAGMVLQRCE